MEKCENCGNYVYYGDECIRCGDDTHYEFEQERENLNQGNEKKKKSN